MTNEEKKNKYLNAMYKCRAKGENKEEKEFDYDKETPKGEWV